MDGGEAAGTGIDFKFEVRPLEGKVEEGAAKYRDAIMQWSETQKPEDRLWTAENIVEKRAQAIPMMMSAFENDPVMKAMIDENDALCETTPIEFTSSTDGATLKIYMIKPKTVADNGPCYVFGRGGGAVMFEAEDMNRLFCKGAVGLNVVMFNVGFRNGPEVKCPTGQQDFVDAFLHLHKNAAEYKIDPSKMTIGGNSGGGWICVGAANLMVKSGEIGKVHTMHVHTGMLSNSVPDTPEDQLKDHEYKWESKPEHMTNVYKMHATDFENQAGDDQLYPGKASDEIMSKYPPVCVYTQEFDFLRRDNEMFAERLKKVGRLVDISILPGCLHACMGTGWDAQEQIWNLADAKAAFDATIAK